MIFYHPIDGSAPLSVSFSSLPKGDATDAKNEAGVGFFSPNSELLGVIFDDVDENKDHQFLLFPNHRVDVWTNHGKVKVELTAVRKRKKAEAA